MFYLPNNKKIDEEAICGAFEDMNLNNIYYLDAETGHILLESEKILKDYNLKGSKRYYRIPKIPTVVELGWMKELAEELIAIENPFLAGILLQALKKSNSKDEFIKVIKKNEESWIHGWNQWRADATFEEIEIWLDGLPIDIREDWQEFFEENCDCPICKAMAEGRDDFDSLKDAFRKANFKQVMGNIDKTKK